VKASEAQKMSGGLKREQMLPLLKRHEIQVLRGAGHSRAEVARLAGVSVNTVKRVDRETEVVAVDDRAEARRRGIGRPSKAEPFREWIGKALEPEPELPTLELLRRARLAGYDGQKTAFYGLVQSLRPVPKTPLVRFEGLPGEFTQHDFGEVDVRFVDGSRKRVQFFATRLKYSRWVEVSVVSDQRVETLCRALAEHFARIGGVPLLAVFDRPKTVVVGSTEDGRPEFNPTFAQVMLELGVGVELCAPRSGNQKGAVENLVGWVKGSFFKCRRFVDEGDLQAQLAEWLVYANTERPSRATGKVPLEAKKAEDPRLRPLKVAPDQLALRIPIVVGPTGYVSHDAALYSMPPEAIGIAGTLYLYPQLATIRAGRFEATHLRQAAGGQSSLAEHRVEHVAAVSGKRGKRYLERQHLLALGDPAHAFLTELVHRRPRAWTGDVTRLHEMLVRVGDETMRGAFAWAVERELFGAEYIAHHLRARQTGEDSDSPVCEPRAAQQLSLEMSPAAARSGHPVH
jgi:transposase